MKKRAIIYSKVRKIVPNHKKGDQKSPGWVGGVKNLYKGGEIMNVVNEKVAEVKLKALEIISNKLVADISVCELINLCACLNNNFKEDDYFSKAMELLNSSKQCSSCDKKEEKQSDESLE